MHLMWVMQAHHIDTDYYDRFFGPGAYGRKSPQYRHRRAGSICRELRWNSEDGAASW
jgi:hypothetical protein